MKLSKPSPAMVVAVIALVMATTGGAIAAVNYANNAGAVDRYSAIGASATNAQAAGKLVATAKGGANLGKIPHKFLADVPLANTVARGKNGATLVAVPDNGETSPQTLLELELGNLQIACRDENKTVGKENAATKVSVTNHSGGNMNLARRVGTGVAVLANVENNTVHTFEVGAENTFEFHLQAGAKSVLVEGVARQGQPGVASTGCGVYATALIVD